MEFSIGTQVNGHLYNIGNNKEYIFNNKFDLEVACPYLSGNRTLISGYSVQEHDATEDEGRRTERPTGVKEAEKRKLEAKTSNSAAHNTVQQSAQAIETTMKKTQEEIVKKNEGKLEI